MLKGISRQMVEITDTGSPYFERAYLVVRADCAEPQEGALRAEGVRVLRHASPHTGVRMARRRMWRERVLSALCAGGSGVALGWLLWR